MESEGQLYGWDDKHNILFFCVKMVKATRDYFYLEILCPDGMFTKILCI